MNNFIIFLNTISICVLVYRFNKLYSLYKDITLYINDCLRLINEDKKLINVLQGYVNELLIEKERNERKTLRNELNKRKKNEKTH